MPRSAHAPQMPQLFDSFLTMQQEIWEKSFRLLSAFTQPTTHEARPAASQPREARKPQPSAAPRERPNASAGSKRRARGTSRGKR